jgi:hypothetical protein
MDTPTPNTPSHPISLADFMRLPGSLQRFVHVENGQLVPSDPDSPEVQAAYQQILAALEAGTIADLTRGSGPRDR